MAGEYKQAAVEVKGKEEKIKEYFGVKKNQQPKVEDMEKPKDETENDPVLKVERELDLARDKYVGVNFENKNALAKISKFLHIGGDLGDKEALALKYSKYKNKLDELLNLKIEELKRQNPGGVRIGEKMRDLKIKFDFEEGEKLRVARAKFEPQQKEDSGDHNQTTPKKKELVSEKLSKPAESKIEKKTKSILRNIKKCINESAKGPNEKWEKIKGRNFYETAEKMGWRSNGELDAALRSLREELGEGVRPESFETLEEWKKRVSELAVEKSE